MALKLKQGQTETEKDPVVHKKQQARYEALITSLSDGIIVRDQQLLITKLTPALTEMLGYSEEDLLGKKIRDVIRMKRLGEQPVLISPVLPLAKIFNGSDLINGTYSWTCKNG